MAKRRNLHSIILWSITIVTMIVLLLSHTYGDILITTRHGMNLWYSLFKGDFLNFFSANHVRSGNIYFADEQGAAYNILIYIVFAIWNLPLVWIETFTKIDVMNNVPCLVYMKLLPVFAMVVSAYLLKRILSFLGLGKKKESFFVYIYLSSILMLTVVALISQYDILSTVWQLAGIYAFLKKDKKSFILFFGIACCFKYFALIVFIPLLLIMDKKVLKIGLAFLCFLIPIVLTKVPFYFAAQTDATEAPLLRDLLIRAFGPSVGFVNPFVFIYVLVLVWCYIKKPSEDAKETLRFISWVCFACFASFFGLMELYPYWSIMLAPYVVLLLASMPPERFRIGLILETFSLIGLVFGNMLKYNWCYFGDTMKPMILSKIFGDISYENSILYGIIVKLGTFGFAMIIPFTIFYAASVAMLILSFPLKKEGVSEYEQSEDKSLDVLYLRAAVTLGLCLMPVLSNFI